MELIEKQLSEINATLIKIATVLQQLKPNVNNNNHSISNPETLLIQCDLSVRLLMRLESINVQTIGDLLNVTEYDILRIPGLGRKSWYELKEFAYNKGIRIPKR